jgi:hypothetical protein
MEMPDTSTSQSGPARNGVSATAAKYNDKTSFLPGLILPTIVFLIQVIILWKFSIDDVAISYRYASHLAQGAGLTWNPGQPPVEGYSNFLWVLLLAAGAGLGIDIEIFSKIIGVLFGVLTLAALFMLSRRLGEDRRWWWLPPLLVAVCPVWVLWAVSGLELAMVGFWLVLAVTGMTCAPRRRMWILCLASCGLCLSRPEGAVIAAAIPLFGLFVDRAFPRQRRLVIYGIPLVVLAVCLVGLLVFRLQYFGSLLANTVYAKFSTDLPSSGKVGHWVLYGLPFFASFIAVLWGRAHSSRSLILQVSLLVILLQMLLVLPVSPVMFVQHRYLIPFLPLLVLAVPGALERLAEFRRGTAIVGAVVLLGWSLQSWPSVGATYKAERFYYQRHQCVVEKLAQLPGRPTIALLDAGRIPYWSDLPAVDVWGLCDARIARDGFSAQAIWDSPYGIPQVYIMSGDTVTGGINPRLGFDGLISRDVMFQKTYRLWAVCPGNYYYGYAILLDRAWARREGVEFHAP